MSQISSKARLVEMDRKANQENRNIYYLKMSDGSKFILKIYNKGTEDAKKSIKREVEGLQYAFSAGVPSPELCYYNLSSTNPLGLKFLIVRYITIVSVDDLFVGETEISIGGKKFRINVDAVEKHVQDCIAILCKLHTPTGSSNSIYSSMNMKKTYRTYQKLIQRRSKPRYRKQLNTWLEAIFEFYEQNQQAFLASPEYHLHGDLDPSNIVHTCRGIVLLDWEYYHKGDCCEDIAFFAERNLILSDKHLRTIIDRYSSRDKLWHVVVDDLPLNELSEYMKKHFE
jgi:aminoglycoside phosphotransferase (APT) family kinase protein